MDSRVPFHGLSGDGRQTSGPGISAGEASTEALDGISQERQAHSRVRPESSKPSS